MKTIKFRGKSKKDGEWFYGNLYDKDVSGNTHIMTVKCGCLNVDPETVGQFTGKTDKNGNEIYEGDILEYTFKDGVKSKEKYLVLFDEDSLSFRGIVMPSRTLFEGLKMEVVGNIHDNPELLIR